MVKNKIRMLHFELLFSQTQQILIFYCIQPELVIDQYHDFESNYITLEETGNPK